MSPPILIRNLRRSISFVPLIVAFLAITTAVFAQEEGDKRAGKTTAGMLRVVSDVDRMSPVIPTPQETYWGKGVLIVGNDDAFTCPVELRGAAKTLSLLTEELHKRIRKQFGASSAADGQRGVQLVFALDAREAPAEIAETLRGLGNEGYVIKTTANQILVIGNSETALWHGMATVSQLISRQGKQLVFPEVEIVDYPLMSERALLVDIGGQGFMVGPSRWGFEQWKEFVDWMVDHKFNVLWLEFIGSGTLMGNLNMEAGEWIGFPLALKSYPQLVCKDRPIRRWDTAQGKVVADTYTAPNVKQDFVGDLITYAQARGIKCHLFVGYDYFAFQLPFVLKVPHNDPAHPEANKVYDAILKEITQRYRHASGVMLCTIENKNQPTGIIHQIIRRTNEAYDIIRSINPKMEVGLLADYLEWQPEQLEHIRLLRQRVPKDVSFGYSPHREPQQKSWQRVHGDVWRYMNYTQYAWDHVAYLLPSQIKEETLGSYAVGYRKIVTQAWYFDVFAVNYMALSEYSWNATSCSVEQFWEKATEKLFGKDASDLMRTALKHTRFDIRFDIVARMIVRDKLDRGLNREFTFWDMYVLHRIPRLTDAMLKDLEEDARQSLKAAQAALPMASNREMVEMTVISAERRLHLATSARHLLKALDLKKAGDKTAARDEINRCLQEGEKLYKAATRLGIEFPMAVHDAQIVEKYRRIHEDMKR